MSSDSRLDRFGRLAALHEGLQQTGLVHRRHVRFIRDFAQSKIGKHAARFETRLENLVERHLILQQVQGVPVRLPVIAAADRLMLARNVGIHWRTIGQHVLVIGSSGRGKSYFIRNLVAQLLARGIRIIFSENKEENRLLIQHYPETMVFGADHLPVNVLEEVGPAHIYHPLLFTEIGRQRSAQPARVNAAIAFMDRVHRGLKPGEARPSLTDFAQLLIRQPDNLLKAFGHDLISLNVILGKTATVRRGVELSELSPLVVLEFQSVPARVASMLRGILLSRFQLGMSQQGHSSQLRLLYVADEPDEFRKEAAGAETFGYVPHHKRLMRKLRSYGMGIIVGAQDLSDLDPTVIENHRTTVVFGCQSHVEARNAQQQLGLPDTATPEIQNLAVGECFIRSEGFSAAVRDTLPLLQFGDYPNDAAVEQHMAPVWEQLERRLVRAPAREASTPISYSDVLTGTRENDSGHITTSPSPPKPQPESILAEYWHMLREIIAHPGASVAEHYQNLGWSAGKGNRVKECLIELGLISSERQKSTNGRPRERLVLTQNGKELSENEAPRS